MGTQGTQGMMPNFREEGAERRGRVIRSSMLNRQDLDVHECCRPEGIALRDSTTLVQADKRFHGILGLPIMKHKIRDIDSPPRLRQCPSLGIAHSRTYLASALFGGGAARVFRPAPTFGNRKQRQRARRSCDVTYG
jgi:hypothetical protein